MLDPNPRRPLSERDLLLVAAVCAGLISILLALSCTAQAQALRLPPTADPLPVTGTRVVIRGAPASVWPVWQKVFAPCLETDPACLAEGPRWIPPQETVETVRALVVAYFRAQVAKGTLTQDLVDPCWSGWTPEQMVASGCASGRIVPWDAIRPTYQFSQCFFSVGGATQGDGQPPQELCAAGTSDGRRQIVFVSVAEKDRTLPLVAWETSNMVTALAHLYDPAIKAPLADGPWIGKATAFVMEAMK